MKDKKTSFRHLLDENTDILNGISYGLIIGVVAECLAIVFALKVGEQFNPSRMFIIATVVGTFYLALFSVCPKSSGGFKDFATLLLVVLSQILLLMLGSVIVGAITVSSESWRVITGFSQSALYYGIPVSSGALMLQLVLGQKYGLLCSLTLAYIVSVYFTQLPTLFLHVLLTSFVGCLSLKRVRSRSAYGRAGLHMFLASVVIISLTNISANPSNMTLLMETLSALIGAILAFLITSGFAPVLEVAGSYVTDLRLIEMATLDHPLLKELSIQAPGTWNHSMVMGMMSEAAAEAVGANPVLAKVGSYFHDIGKSRKPLYFVENQFGGENRHDRLNPSMSALIIRSHVRDGLEMAKKHGLPSALQDMISQHHGTSTIYYFYDKALKAANQQDSPCEVDETHYKYPGPKPQTREAGILMLADGIEAASRTMSEPSFDRIQGMVQKMINKVFASGQLDECDLTLRDLHHIARCFTRVLSGIHHQRISYSEPVEKGAPSNVSRTVSSVALIKETPEVQLPENSSDVPPESDPTIETLTGKENLKRLGVE